MQLDNDITILRQIPLFHGMDEEDLSMIAFSAERLLFRHGEHLVQEDRLGQAAYVILSGSAEVCEGAVNKRRIRLVRPGTMIGELAMLVEFTYTSTVTALEETLALELRREMIHQMMYQFPPIGEHFSGRIHSRLAKMAETMRAYEQPAGTLSFAQRKLAS